MSAAILFISTLLLALAANPAELTWTEAELAMANTAENVSYLTTEEKRTIMLVNLARLDGKKYLLIG